jgi:hypothetical protein
MGAARDHEVRDKVLSPVRAPARARYAYAASDVVRSRDYGEPHEGIAGDLVLVDVEVEGEPERLVAAHAERCGGIGRASCRPRAGVERAPSRARSRPLRLSIASARSRSTPRGPTTPRVQPSPRTPARRSADAAWISAAAYSRARAIDAHLYEGCYCS